MCIVSLLYVHCLIVVHSLFVCLFVCCMLIVCLLYVCCLFITLLYVHCLRWFLRLALFALPLPWIASELGWFVSEFGRQPWLVEGMLPTFLGVSSISLSDIIISLVGFVVFYSSLAVVEVYLMLKYIRLGPDGTDLVSVAEVQQLIKPMALSEG